MKMIDCVDGNSFLAAENLEKWLLVGLQHKFTTENHLVETVYCKHQRERFLLILSIIFFRMCE